MKLLDHACRLVADRWERIEEGAALPAGGAAILATARLLADPPPPAGLELGAELAAGAELASVLPWLDRLSLVVVPFPVFRDGRGFTAARALRERHDFDGEIRAAGHVLPDQYVALLRVGVSTVELPDDADLEPWATAFRLGGQTLMSRALPWIRREVLPFQAA